MRQLLLSLRPVALLSLIASACGCAGAGVGIPKNVKAVEPFDAARYAGTWYEIARLPVSFEKGLEKITAEYRPRPRGSDGGIDVINRGYDPVKGKWSEAKGKAYFVGPSNVGRLKVSFFGPFYGAYNVIALDPDYTTSMVCGPNYQYLWILSRTATLPQEKIDALLAQAKSAGFDTSKMIYPKQ